MGEDNLENNRLVIEERIGSVSGISPTKFGTKDRNKGLDEEGGSWDSYPESEKLIIEFGNGYWLR